MKMELYRLTLNVALFLIVFFSLSAYFKNCFNVSSETKQKSSCH